MSVRTCLNVQVCVRAAFTCCGSLYRGVILTYKVCALLRSVQSWGIQVSLPYSDMKTISLRADLYSAAGLISHVFYCLGRVR